MVEISREIIYLIEKQGFVVVSTLDKSGSIHCSAKGIAGIESCGQVFLIDLYLNKTFSNLKENPVITITAIDEHKFMGFCLKGKAKIVGHDDIKDHIREAWEEKVIKRVSDRVLKGIKEDKQNAHHPESLFPHPKYLIEMDVEEIVDLTPSHLKTPKT